MPQAHDAAIEIDQHGKHQRGSEEKPLPGLEAKTVLEREEGKAHHGHQHRAQAGNESAFTEMAGVLQALDPQHHGEGEQGPDEQGAAPAGAIERAGAS